MKLLKEFLKKTWYLYLLGILTLVAIDLAQLIIPKYIAKVIDSVKTIQSIDEVKVFVLSILGLAFGMLIGRFFWRFFIIRPARYFDYYAKKYLFDKILSLDMHFFDKRRSGDIMAYFTNDIATVERMLSMGVVQLTDALFMTTATLFFMASTAGWRLTLISLIPLPLIVVISLLSGKLIFKRSRKLQDLYSDLSGYTEETIDGIRVVKSFSILPKIESIFDEKAFKNFRASMNLVRIWGIIWPAIHFIGTISYFLALSVGGPMVIKGYVSLGEYIAFNNYIGMLIWPLTAFGWVINQVQQGRASISRLNDILKSEPVVKEPENPKKIESIEEITVNNLSFAYPNTERLVLKNVNLSIKRGQLVGIVGTVGSGKSTLVKLIAKFYPVERGMISINGKDINDLSSENVRTKISYVPQETFLFSTSVTTNVAFGMDNFDFNEVVRYLEFSNVKEDVEQFPEKYETVVGQRGVLISGGQKQRITISRALMKKADVYIFDDCLSAVDPETEEKIIRNIRREMKNTTMVIITHRLKVLQNADIIYVFENGEVVEYGNHKQLIAKNGLYARMWKKQLVVVE